ncbi:MAG TPA: methyltransferase domain-containing protein [Tepidisphaeraceae bacterium]|nr:methyltransferase domain-containing protein [Tepidisphaeraceae bacterium]
MAQQRRGATDWGSVADWYDQLVGDEGSDFHQKVIIPGVTRLLAIQPGQRVIDIACGQGVLCRHLHSLEAGVTGIDAARPLIDAARRRGPADIDYRLLDASQLSTLEAGSFAAATCILAIQNINPLPPIMNGIAHVLSRPGRLVIVMMHPCFRGPKETSWGWDEKSGVQYRRIDRYLLPRKSPIVTHPGKPGGGYTWSFHRPIETYIKALRNAGLLVDAIEEWPSHRQSTSGPRAAAENRAREEIPMFMALRAVKQ